MKEESIRIRLTEDEKEKIKTAANKNGFRDMTDYILVSIGIRKIPNLKK